MSEHRFPLKRCCFPYFQPHTIYIGATCRKNIFKGWNNTFTSRLSIDSCTYNAPVSRLMLLGYFIRATYEDQKIYYTFFHPYNHEEIVIPIDYFKGGLRYYAFFAEYPIECIISQQIPIICLLACKKNLPFGVIHMIQEYIGEEGNLELQELLEHTLKGIEQRWIERVPQCLKQPKLFEYLKTDNEAVIHHSPTNLY